jgi:cephalosporin-C deacetylase-like acetyl esterase
MSMGSRWGVQVGAADKRVKAVVGQMANVGSFDIIFEQAQPNFKRIFMYMTGYSDEDAFDEHMKTHDKLPDVAKQLSVPHLLVAGDMDELCTPQDIENFRGNLAGSSELWLYEGIFHPMGEVSAEIYPAMADWMLTTLNEGRPAGERVTAYIEEGTTLAEHEHG